MKKLFLATLMTLSSLASAVDYTKDCQTFTKKRPTQYSGVAVDMCHDVQDNKYALHCIMALAKFENIADGDVHSCLKYNNAGAAHALSIFISFMDNLSPNAVAIIGNVRSQGGYDCIYNLVYRRGTISDNALQACAK